MNLTCILLIVLTVTGTACLCLALSNQARNKGFVYIHEIDPTIIISARYAGTENFIGDIVDGYEENKNIAIMTKKTALALKKVQKDVNKDEYSLVIYDAYRPQHAVDHFVTWGKDIADQVTKHKYYPRIDKKTVFELGYVNARSQHSRGSTVDVTLIKTGKKIQRIKTKNRKLTDGTTVMFLDDGTVDMGTSFDLFDLASRYSSTLVSADARKNRTYLRTVMERHGFKGCGNEWWHFLLINEPYPKDQDSSYFNFPAA